MNWTAKQSFLVPNSLWETRMAESAKTRASREACNRARASHGQSRE